MMMMMSLKIIAGKFKGRSIQTVASNAVRPTSGRVRQSLLDSLGAEVVQATVLDGFAGSGIIGIECLSRGATQVLAVEKEASHCRKIQANVQQLGLLPATYRLVNRSLEQVLSGKNLLGQPFSLVYLDPPYSFAGWEGVMQRLLTPDWLAQGASVLLEHGLKEPAFKAWQASVQTTHPQLVLERELAYGDTVIAWYRWVG
ncbi:MAG: 16S rRNA (guanine(966)-N(2))-methyltransferase RsmD [Candidatus Melainabacteria bacterium]|nr:16S rRNA (guanine(966)-N(2))-methyltransferase RsmD [Candidatus Melainabacteria bacterium]